ncbi:ATP-binding cassette domain-containing protein [candidate division KSB3 bacterium]|uniref:ATP-binding cassette domain-containing protein n=1 Tax=candidate division KSB3 bacterium TaxID=2044937 RepID=A0A9D5Q3S6_9BACT|nr:ATP-binding cassette domain-containing protein [candidate division KSB3 bacterium]MBD3322949.1 ATP-binding cassette domain-containing protein [candidate division KSB3 bacterium]
MALLEVQKLTKYFGGLAAVKDLTFDVHEGEILALIGPNGAGKSTVFNLITSYLKPTDGTVTFQGQNITRMKTPHIARLGVVRTFQETNVYRDMTVMRNVLIANHLHCRASDWGEFFYSHQARADEQETTRRTLELLEYFGLSAFQNEVARGLPHGHLRALEIAMGMAADPKLLLLDEPFTGMNPEETDRAMEMVRGIRDNRGVTVLLVEHDMRAVMGLSDRIVVINFGQKIAEGKPVEIQHNDLVIEAYLGKETD